ncbi:PKD domain protein [Owenweeksia hongkongensis DSM 17368]|uniref:PKD domain protein n=1 Tax=Owenweeksia hongkongensis (strain DSM 17368 / CIP 108786 / JCM 12287 / NRRL B-23963 / UST20020801) TaxID=926562 RepID=G8R6H4_OWEHD|nr:choice-of-anchor J domain-containing protein [Owenweeksia hongkongensis]AEV34437.1 PKD domain protein [Owenweeksia hongkongensis DSM 17368]
MKKASPLYLFVSAFMLMSTVVMGQLSGAYTINGSSPTGGTNYQTFTAAVSALTSNGVSGAVTFNVQAGTYTEQISISAISGASTTNTITFKGLGDLTTITAAPTMANLPIISLDSASHITIDSLNIEVTGTNGWGVHFMRHADSNAVINSHIVGPALSNTRGIIGSSSITTISVVQNNAEYILIENNTIEGFDVSINMVGETGPITTPNRQINYGTDISIIGNTFQDFAGKAVVINNYHNVNVDNNEISTSNTASSGALSFWDAGDNIIITRNNMYVNSDANNTRMIILAMAPGNGPAGDATKPAIVANNMIQYHGTNSTTPTGLLMKNKDQIEIFNNTFKIKNQGANANCIWFDNNNARTLSGVEVRNNIFALDNAGSGQFFYCRSSAIGSRFNGLVIDHNNYYAPAGYFSVDIPDGSGLSTFTSFAAYKANTGGWGTGAMNVDPQFVSATDLHASSVAMNDSGAVISSITTDIDGDLRSATYPDMGADEYAPPSCVGSSNLGVFDAFGSTAKVYWTQSNMGATVKVQYGTTGFTLGSGTKMTATNDTISLTGLTPQSTYDVYVMEVCSPTDSSAWTSLSFTIGCGVVSTYPYYESFEGSNWVSGSGTPNSGFSIDPCWSVVPSSGNVFLWGTGSGSTSTSFTGPPSAYGGSNYVFAQAYNGFTNDIANFTSPNLDLSSLTVPQLTFGYHMYGIHMGTLEVWAWNGTAYDTLTSISGDQGNTWREAIIDLSPYKNDTTHLVFHAIHGISLYSDIAIDSIVIEEAPPCPKPGVVAFDNVTATSVNLVFSSPGHAFEVEFGPTGFTQGTGTTTTINGSGDTITGLTPNTSYDFYLNNNCTDSSNGFSAWVGPFTVRTECSFTNSYFTDWDYLSNSESDICWSFLTFGSNISYARAYDPSAGLALQPFSGNIYYRYYNSTATATFLVSPEITDLATNTLQVRFQASDSYTGTSGTPEFYIGTMLSANDTASFTPLDTVTTITDVWTEFAVPLTGVPANHKYVVIRHAHNANNVYMAIDDLYIEVQPACVAPSFGVFSDVRDTSVVLNWTAGDGSTFDIEYGAAGFTQGLGTTISGLTSTTDTLTGLTPFTCYDVYIRGNCTSSNSPWYGPISLCTKCVTKVAPFVEDFESSGWVRGTAATNAVDGCWIRTPESFTSFRWETNFGSTTSSSTGPSTGGGGSGKYVFTEASRGVNNSLAYLQMPKVDFSTLTTPTLSFSYHMHGSQIGELYVLIDDGTQTDTIWSISGQQQVADTSDWITAYVDISAYMTQPATISFVAKRGGTYGDIALDNVGIDELPTCLIPTAFSLDSVYTNFADFSWTSISNGTSFVMEYGPTGFRQATATGTNVYAGSSPTRVSGLTPGMTYDIYLSDMCDSTDWVGPITFTTIIQNDAELESIVSPFDLVCGDSSLVIEVKVKNNGINAITTLPVGANISGAITSSVTITYTGNIAPGASATITVGTINAYTGGVINIDAYTGLSGDQNMTNDTLSEAGLELISAVPLHMPVDSICANDTSGIFVALPQTGISHNWYANANDVTPVATGDTVSVQPGQTLYLDRGQSSSLVVQTGTAGSLFGTMFKVYVKRDFIFSGYTWVSHQTGAKSLKAFYKMGDYKGHETTRSSWTLIDSLEQTSSSSLAAYRFNFRNPVIFTAGDTISIYLASKTGKYEAEGLAGATVDSVFKTTNDFEYIAGVGGAYFGSNMVGATSASSIAKTLHWESLDVCGNNRIALTMGVNNDTAVASFSSVVNASGVVDFDASASSGHVYDWDFGNGTTGTGEMPSNTYTAGGTYTVTLTVTDTVCGTTDTITQTIFTDVSLNELEFAGSVEVYPNPNNGKFNINLDLIGGQDVQLALVNTVGQIIYTKDLGNVGGHVETDMDIENLAPGVYYLRVIANGKSTTVRVTIL